MSKFANVSVIIATLDRPDSLRRCLDALLSGEVLPTEVIIVDQSYDDATRLVIENHRDSGVRVIYRRKQQRNASASRNVAINDTSCSIVAVSDDDCIPDQRWIAAIERTFDSPAAPDAMTGRVLAQGPDKPGLFATSLRESTTRTEFNGQMAPWVVGTGGNFAAKREWLNRVGGYDERLGPGSPGRAAEDIDLFYRLLRAGATIRFEPDALIYHERKNKSGRMASRWNYGFGTGAFCSIWLRQGDFFALRIVGHLFLHQCRLLIRAIGHRQWLQAYQRSLSLRGTARGLVYGLRVN